LAGRNGSGLSDTGLSFNLRREANDPNLSLGYLFRTMNIRPAISSDETAITKLVFDILRDYGLQPDPGTTDVDLSDIESHYFKNGGSFEVMENGIGRIVGTVGIYPMKKGMCELRKMYLDTGYRGKGYGKTLMDHAFTRAKELGFTCMVLETASVLKEAINLYKKNGFEPYEAEHLSDRCDQAYIKKLK
jgi:putative acetyltransferase